MHEDDELSDLSGLMGLGSNAQPTIVYTSSGTGSTLTTAADDAVDKMTDVISNADFEILTSYSKKDILKKLKKFKENHKIINISLSTDTKYSKTFDKEYTEYTVLIQYL